MSARAELMKQYRSLVKNIDSFSDGQAALSENQPDSDSMTQFIIVIKPNDGFYKNGKFEFEIDLSDNYPASDPPKIHSLTKVYHPNIDQIDEYSEGDICLNLLDELWTPDLTLEDYVQGLLFMFYNPNVEDPLNPAFDGGETDEKVRYNVRMSMRGKEVEGIEYDNVLEDGYESEDGETYEEDYDARAIAKLEQEGTEDDANSVSGAGEGNDDIASLESLESNDNNGTNDESIVVPKTDDVATLPTIEEIDEATGQHEPAVNSKPPLPYLSSTLSWLLGFLRRSPMLFASYGGDEMMTLHRPSLSTLVLYSMAFVAFRFGLRILIRTRLKIRT